MLYTIICHDRENSLTARKEKRAEHRGRIQALQAAGRLLVAGPFPAVDATNPEAAGYTGSLIVAEFPSLQEAEDWAAADPYISNGVYDSVDVKPFVNVFS